MGGLPHQKSKLAEVLGSDVQRFARHRFASLVLSSALANCSAAESHGLAVAVMKQAGAVTSLACHSFGLRVVRALLVLPWDSEQVRFYLLKSSRRLQKDKFGSQLLEELNTQGCLGAMSVARVGGVCDMGTRSLSVRRLQETTVPYARSCLGSCSRLAKCLEVWGCTCSSGRSTHRWLEALTPTRAATSAATTGIRDAAASGSAGLFGAARTRQLARCVRSTVR